MTIRKVKFTRNKIQPEYSEASSSGISESLIYEIEGQVFYWECTVASGTAS